MKRRNLLASTAAVLMAPALAEVSSTFAATGPDPSRLNNDLTPLGGERAGNASGTIPAWTGGMNVLPPDYPQSGLPQPIFSDEKPVFTVTQANMGQYSAMLSQGQQLLLQRYGAAGFKIEVYPCHRTACAPQYVYDNTAKNVTRAQALPAGITQGISGAFGGVPFPILSDDPATAGAQAIWNHELRWLGPYSTVGELAYVVGNNQKVMTSAFTQYLYTEYYDPDVTPDNFSKVYGRYYIEYAAPANIAGGKFLTWYSVDPNHVTNQTYEYLVGEGRVRELPEAEYDTPATQFADTYNYDESFLFLGALDRYDWKLVGKKEMIVPYNNNAVLLATPDDLLGNQFANPELFRHEIHRVWVVEATLAPGKRMSDPFRRFYVDEDTWQILLSDVYDHQGNYWRFGAIILEVDPRLPGTTARSNLIYNLQEQEYTFAGVLYNSIPEIAGGMKLTPIPRSLFDPESMASSGAL
jgi:hypothetical protein